MLERGGATLGDPLAGLLLAAVLAGLRGPVELLAHPGQLGPTLGQRCRPTFGVGGSAGLLALERGALVLQGRARALLEPLAQPSSLELRAVLLEHRRALPLLESLAQLGLLGASLLLLEHRGAQPLLESLAQPGLARAQVDQQGGLGLASTLLFVLGGDPGSASRRAQPSQRTPSQLGRVRLALALGLGLLVGGDQCPGLGLAPTLAQPLLELRGSATEAASSSHRPSHPPGPGSQIATLALSLLLTLLDDLLLQLARAGLAGSLFAAPRSSLGDPTVLAVDLDREATLPSLELGIGLALAGHLIELATQAVVFVQRLLELGRQQALLEQALQRRRLASATLGQQRGELAGQIAGRRGLGRGLGRRRLGGNHGRRRGWLGPRQILPATVASHVRS